MKSPEDSFQKIFGNKKRIMVVMAHPDDAEIYCGGTLARLVREGKRVRVVKMTLGSRGSKQEKISEKDLERVRLSEDKKAMKVLGIKPEDNIYLGLRDGSVDNDIKIIEKLVKQIRIFKPDIIITHNPEDIIIRFGDGINWVNHRDHRNTGKDAIDAAYPYSRDLLFFPEHFKEKGVSFHATTEFLLVDYYNHPDLVYIDVSDYVEFRTKALASHSSQYTLDHAKNSTDFFTKHPSGRRFDRFRYVIAD